MVRFKTFSVRTRAVRKMRAALGWGGGLGQGQQVSRGRGGHIQGRGFGGTSHRPPWKRGQGTLIGLPCGWGERKHVKGLEGQEGGRGRGARGEGLLEEVNGWGHGVTPEGGR